MKADPFFQWFPNVTSTIACQTAGRFDRRSVGEFGSLCYTKTEHPDDELCLVHTSGPFGDQLTTIGIARRAGSYRFSRTQLQLQHLPTLWFFFRHKDGSYYSDYTYIKL